ncbi:MAG: D-alanine--D-alanine ligase [Gemmatimonadales bacterium]|nr:MAG: D-alanine--D-alanine ligase [Gemmatimonadales bacterium]
MTLRVAVLMGGTSGERNVSLASGVQVARALRDRGHQVLAVDTARGLMEWEEEIRILETGVAAAPAPAGGSKPGGVGLLDGGDLGFLGRVPELAEVDVIFPALHGGAGEDGTLQGVLELAGLPYAGSGRLGCTLAMDKEVSKRLFVQAGIPTAPWMVSPVDPEEVVEGLGLPLIVKPPSGGSTLGLTLVRDATELEGAVSAALRYEDRVLFERFVKGRELTVGILGDRALPVGEIIPKHELFDYDCKYVPGMAEEIFPARIPDELAQRLQALALQVHRVLFMREFSRVDFLVDSDGGIWCLEANALPGMTANSLLPRAGAAAGINFPDLCDRIVRLAQARHLRL